MRKFILVNCIIVVASMLSGCVTSGTTSGKGKAYPLDTCIVTDNDLGSMGDAVSITHAGQEIKFCCKPCISRFKANPKKYLDRLPGN